MAAPEDVYMLGRDGIESERLNWQHRWAKALVDDHLLHPTIPLSELSAVADVATGTGVWLRDVQESWPSLSSKPAPELVGFDISPHQFPPDAAASGVAFRVHDAAQPFPVEYHGRFDVVNVRLMSYAIRTTDLDAVVANIAATLRPGGYLQWQECDMVDAYATPETQKCKDVVAVMIRERIARGLFPGITSPLIGAIATCPTLMPEDHLNPLSWTDKAFRILQVRTISTLNHPNKTVREHTQNVILKTTEALLKSGIDRLNSDPAGCSQDSIGKMYEIIESMQKSDHELVGSKWDGDTTLILARKAFTIPWHESWMAARYLRY